MPITQPIPHFAATSVLENRQSKNPIYTGRSQFVGHSPKSMEYILETLWDEDDRILSLTPTPRQPCAHPHTPPH